MGSQVNPNLDTMISMGSFSTVGEGEQANRAIPTGGTIIDAFNFEYPHSAVADAEFDASHMILTVMLNEEAIVDHIPVADLIDMETYRDNAETNGYFTHSFREIVAKTKDGDLIYGLVTMPGDDLQVLVDIAGTGVNAAVTLQGWMDVREAPAERDKVTGKPLNRQVPRTMVPKLRKVPYAADAGDNEIDGLARLPIYKRIWFEADDVEKVQVLTTEGLQEVKRFELTNARNNYMQKRHGRVPVAGKFIFDSIVDGYARSKVLNTAGLNGLNFRVTKTAAGSMPMLVESVWPETQLKR